MTGDRQLIINTYEYIRTYVCKNIHIYTYINIYKRRDTYSEEKKMYSRIWGTGNAGLGGQVLVYAGQEASLRKYHLRR